ncbi:magnesium transporter [Marinobacterium jannaschii]|uniref:magnesium transporter n=1 Tax=Marinobacterium jannaschii TaxID=64970 RepID=UPI000486CDE0|nr:magnesium transporter [Marinobacterium jannaschii]
MDSSALELMERVVADLEGDRMQPVAIAIASSSASELARLLEALSVKNRRQLWQQIPVDEKGEVLLALHGEIRQGLIACTEEDDLIRSLAKVQMDELADLDDELPMPVVIAMVQAMDDQRRQRYQSIKDYPDDTAGGLMDADATAVRADVTLKAVFRFMRRIRLRDGNLPEHLDSLMVVDRSNVLQGVLPLSELVSRDLEASVADVMLSADQAFTPLTPAADVARVFEDQDMLSAPVIDDNRHLLGRITVDDVIDVLRSEADKEVFGRAGLDQHPDMFAPVMRSSVKRAVWLGINLLTAFLAAWVIGLFEKSIEQVVALAVLMPVVASMGGVAGSQTLTLVTRGLALNQVGRSNLWRLMGQELSIGAINGLFWALVVASVASLWFSDWYLGTVFGLALVIVLLAGALAGTVIPLTLKKLGIDPALAGGVVLTTITDVIGFFTFLGLATWIVL